MAAWFRKPLPEEAEGRLEGPYAVLPFKTPQCAARSSGNGHHYRCVLVRWKF
jgi:hypothetical protein